MATRAFGLVGELLKMLLDDLQQEESVEPPQLQIVCHKLYENLSVRRFTLKFVYAY